MNARQALRVGGAMVGLPLLSVVWTLSEALQRQSFEPPLPLAEHLLIAGQILAVVVAVRWPVPGAALAGACVAFTAVAAYQGSLAVGVLPVVVFVACLHGTTIEGVRSAALVLLGWLYFVLAVPGPSPAVSEYFGVSFG